VRAGADDSATHADGLLFVYGTLQTGQPNCRELRDAELLGEARTTAGHELVDLGAWPGLRRGGRGVVTGELWRVPGHLWTSLDDFEGCPQDYTREMVELEGGVAAWAYVVTAKAARGAPVIAGGNWRAHCGAKNRSGDR
jgi:gamma-glutamylcyclotransferase (GGCT)/AIG2-like uncharacterized protein YtfP